MRPVKFKDPVAGVKLTFALLSVEQLVESPFQRRLSQGHVQRILANSGRGFFRPLLVVPTKDNDAEDEKFVVVDGQHSLAALRQLCPSSAQIPCIILPPGYEHYALLYNVEKADNLQDRCTKAYRLMQDFVRTCPQEPERILEPYINAKPHLLTLAFAAEEQQATGLSVVEFVIQRLDNWLDMSLKDACGVRRMYGSQVALLINTVNEVAKAFDVSDYHARAMIVTKAAKSLWGNRPPDISFTDAINALIETIQATDWSFLSE